MQIPKTQLYTDHLWLITSELKRSCLTQVEGMLNSSRFVTMVHRQ